MFHAKFKIMTILFSPILALGSFTATAQQPVGGPSYPGNVDLTQFPSLVSIYMKRPSGFSTCKADIAKLLKSFNSDVVLLNGSVNDIITSSNNNENCDVTLYFASKSPLDSSTLTSIFSQEGFSIVDWVDSKNGVFIGLSAIVDNMDNSASECEAKTQNKSLSNNWYATIESGNVAVQKVAEGDKGARLRWISDNFDCGDLSKARDVEVAYVIANKADCEANAGRFDGTCTILLMMSNSLIHVAP